MPPEMDVLIDRVMAEFGSVPFPSHRGLRAALAMDDWISEPNELQRITAEQDVKGEWWEIPESELKSISLASCYLDAAGTRFYLPALLVAVLKGMKYAHYNALVSWLKPMKNEPDCALYDYFVERFSALTEGHKELCVDVLRCVASRADPNDQSTKATIEELLVHEYWRESANKTLQPTPNDSRC
jgi:hypothetical protein